MEGQSSDMVQVTMTDEHRLLEACSLGAAAYVQHHLKPRYDEAGLLNEDEGERIRLRVEQIVCWGVRCYNAGSGCWVRQGGGQ